jgi:hypothetical protein
LRPDEVKALRRTLKPLIQWIKAPSVYSFDIDISHLRERRTQTGAPKDASFAPISLPDEFFSLLQID